MLSLDRTQEILNNREYSELISKEQLEAIAASGITIFYGTKDRSIRYIGAHNGQVDLGDEIADITIHLDGDRTLKPRWNKTFWSFEINFESQKFTILDNDKIHSEGVAVICEEMGIVFDK